MRLWLPDGWSVKPAAESLGAQAPDDGISLRAQVLPLTGTLAQADLTGILDDELDDFAVNQDELRAFNDAPYRRLQGTGQDGADAVIFDLRVVPSATAGQALALLFYGEAPDMRDKQTTDAVAAIFKKAMASAPKR